MSATTTTTITSQASYLELVTSLLSSLAAEQPKIAAQLISRASHHQHGSDDEDDEDEEEGPNPREIIRALLTTRSPEPPLPAETLAKIDSLLRFEKLARSHSDPVVDPDTLPRIQKKSASGFSSSSSTSSTSSSTSSSSSFSPASSLSKVSLHRGDITRLQSDAIVNAANSALLGCFQPTHRCIDNVIHDAAGPGLRAACYAARGYHADEPVGLCLLTQAFHLPSRFVLHTVGPQVPRDLPGGPTQDQRNQLSQCYVSCLEAAHAEGSIRSVAFCCISTGLFAFPAPLATSIAITSVLEWLEAHPESAVQHVIFDVFLASDLKLYKQAFAELTGTAKQQHGSPAASLTLADAPTHAGIPANISAHISTSLAASREVVGATAIPDDRELELDGVEPEELALALSWLRSCDSLLICGGAGLSAAAGLDYTSEEICAKIYPTMAQHGFHRFYDAIGKRDWDPALQWGYLLHSTYVSRFHWPRSQIYADLRTITQAAASAAASASPAPVAAESRSFVLTTNADGMFVQNGFDPERVYTIQGDYSRLQCLRPCTQDALFPMLPYIESRITSIDTADTQRLLAEKVPRCPKCSGPMMLNVRGGNWFLEGHFEELRDRYTDFLQSGLRRATAEHPLVILEIGCGFNTPGVTRIPNERMALRHPNLRLIRVNAQYPEVPQAVNGTTAIGLGGNAAEILRHFVRNWGQE